MYNANAILNFIITLKHGLMLENVQEITIYS